MADIRTTITEIAVHATEHDPLSHKAVQVQLAGDRNGGYFIRLAQEDQEIELDPEELPALMEACEQLLRQVRANG
jgi:predicted DNA-binding transcriptional regulator YafY